MSNNEEVKNVLATGQKPQSLQHMIEASVKELGRALPDHLKPERLVRIALTCIRTNPDLTKCTPESFLGALFTSAQLGVEPIAGRAYLLPFNNARKKPDGTWHTIKECQFILGYKGLVDLFYRNEKAVSLQWGVVHENDDFQYEYGTGAFLKHIPAKGNRGPLVAFWVMAGLANGGAPFYVMTSEECLEHGKKHSKTWSAKKGEFYPGSPWVDDFEAMALKTCLIQLCKLLPLSVELQRAVQADESARDIRPGIKPTEILDLPDQTNWDEVEKENEEKLEKALDNEKTKN